MIHFDLEIHPNRRTFFSAGIRWRSI